MLWFYASLHFVPDLTKTPLWLDFRLRLSKVTALRNKKTPDVSLPGSCHLCSPALRSWKELYSQRRTWRKLQRCCWLQKLSAPTARSDRTHFIQTLIKPVQRLLLRVNLCSIPGFRLWCNRVLQNRLSPRRRRQQNPLWPWEMHPLPFPGRCAGLGQPEARTWERILACYAEIFL